MLHAFIEVDMKKPLTILQIIPADGWYARYRDGNDYIIGEAVTCFALVEDPNESSDSILRRRVEPMSISDVGIECCCETSNYYDIVRLTPEQAADRGWNPTEH